MNNTRTDLAIEAAALYNKTSDEISKIDGVEVVKTEKNGIAITHVKILNENGERAIGKKIGNYITIEAPKIRDNDEETFETTEKIISEKLVELMKLNNNSTILAVGLGNWNVTPDALGPKVVSNLSVTRHLFEYLPEALEEKTKSLCAIAPGVLGITGMETSEIIKGVTDMIKPDYIIAIDALASRKTDRISTTIQLADTGITPGSGIGNKRRSIDKDYLGTPVIAIGVPTVVDAATVANDALELLICNIKNNIKQSEMADISILDDENRYPLIKKVLTPYVGELIVTPKEVDTIISDISKVIANSINRIVIGN